MPWGIVHLAPCKSPASDGQRSQLDLVLGGLKHLAGRVMGSPFGF